MTAQKSSKRAQTSLEPTIFIQHINGILGASRQKPAGWRKEGRKTNAIESDKKNQKDFHQRESPLTYLEISTFNSSRNSQYEASMAGGWAAMTMLPWRSLSSRQILLRRRFKRFRITAVPNFLRTIKTTPDALPPKRSHRRTPLTQPITHTANRLRPRRRRRLIIDRPLGVRIRLRNPCLLRRFLLLG